MSLLTPVIAHLIGGAVGGELYFRTSERGVGKANCSWRDPISTDIAALAIGSYLAWKGTTTDEPWVAAAGSAMLTIHLRQLTVQGGL